MRYNERIQEAETSLRKPDYWDNLKKAVIEKSEAGGKAMSYGMTTLAQYNSFRIRKCEEGSIRPYLIEKSIGVNKTGIEQWVGFDGPLTEKEWDELRRAVIEASYAEDEAMKRESVLDVAEGRS